MVNLYDTARHRAWLVLALICVSALPVLLSTDLWTQVPNRDSGVFLYVGSRILHGEIPYRDVWDHKGPIIYYIDALGIVLGLGSQWGVHLLEWLSLYIATFLGFGAMRRLWGLLPAIVGTLAWLFTLPVLLGGGNVTEEYALPLQFAALWLFVTSDENDTGFFRPFAIGLAGSGALLLRQNLIGLWIAIVLCMLIRAVLRRNWLESLKRLLVLSLGMLVPVGIALFYFSSQDALPALWDSYVIYNLDYSSGSTIGSRLTVLLLGFAITSVSGLFLLSIAGWALLLARRRGSSWQGNAKPEVPLLLLIAFPVEILLSSLSGSFFTHYYVPWLPVSALLTAYSIFTIRELRRARLRKPFFSDRFLLQVVVIVIFLGPSVYSIRNIVAAASVPDVRQQASQYIITSTQEADTVLMWGASATVNYLSGRRAPTRYVYQLPFYNRAYSTPQMVNNFLDDLIKAKPVLIIDASEDVGYVPPINSAGSNEWQSTDQVYIPEELDKVLNYISSNYCLVDVIGKEKWNIYRLCTGN